MKTISPEKSVNERGDTVSRHPAFGQVSITRTSGAGHLYGSDFNHQYAIRMVVSRSELHRSLSEDRHFGRDELLSLTMSEAQWATFVSAIGVGAGVPCTLGYIQAEGGIPGIKKEERADDVFRREALASCEEAMNQIALLQEAINNTSLSGVKKKELTSYSERIRSSLQSSLPFVLSQFNEHMEQTVEAARVEVNAYLQTTAARTGLQAIASGAQLALDNISKVENGDAQ